MNELKEIDDKIENLIYEVRGKKVMLDCDLARLYGVETRVFNQAVKRNMKRFPEYYMFQLSNEEKDSLYCSRSQFVTLNVSNNKRGSNIKYNPYAFTEYGISMLSSVLHSDIAVQISIKIIDTFVELRHNKINCNICNDRFLNIEKELNNQKESINKVLDYMDKHKEKEENIFYDGMIYDAISFLTNFKKSEF